MKIGGPARGPKDSEAALRAALDRLGGGGTLSAEQADAVRREVDSWRPPTEPPPTEPPPTEPPAAAPAPRPWTMLLAEVGGYVGGAFVLGAGIVLAGQTWAELTTAARVAVLLVPA